LTVLAFTMTAMAASKDGIFLSKDGRKTVNTNDPPKGQPYVENNAGLTTIFDNLAHKYPDGLYWCCAGGTIEGQGGGGPEWWQAAAFTPGTTLNVTKIEVALQYITGTYTDVLLSLNNDDGTGRPGAVIEKWKVTGMPPSGSCCTIKTKSSAGIPVTAGTQYWVVVSTEKKSDVWATWNDNDTKQLDSEAIPQAYYCYSTTGYCGTHNGVWTPYQGYQGNAFAVLGK
jgi:hypothetical protein